MIILNLQATLNSQVQTMNRIYGQSYRNYTMQFITKTIPNNK